MLQYYILREMNSFTRRDTHNFIRTEKHRSKSILMRVQCVPVQESTYTHTDTHRDTHTYTRLHALSLSNKNIYLHIFEMPPLGFLSFDFFFSSGEPWKVASHLVKRKEKYLIDVRKQQNTNLLNFKK